MAGGVFDVMTIIVVCMSSELHDCVVVYCEIMAGAFPGELPG